MTIIELCLFLFYVTRVLLFEEKESHHGPFPSRTESVYDEETHHLQPVTLFDRIRRYSPFNPYTIKDGVWIVDKLKMERWTCPLCLSFWTAFFPTAYLASLNTYSIIELVFLHFTMAAVSSILNYMVDYVQLRSKTEESI